MAIQLNLPVAARNLYLVSLGAAGYVYRLNDIAIKKCRPNQEEDMANEQNIFTYLERHAPSPHIVQSFYRVPNAIFLEFAPAGDVAAVLQDNQEREGSPSWRVTKVLKTQPVSLCCLWVKQLCAAATWLEEIGLCHGDIRPPNMLFQNRGHMKLADFDRAIRAGEHLDAGTEPFARLVGDEGGRDRGTYGTAGPRTEQFAIGSVLYSLTRGHEPYDDEYWGKDHGPLLLEKFQRVEFPPLGDSTIDQIIKSCWYGHYGSVAELLRELECLDCDQPTIFDREGRDAWERACIAECEALVEGGGLDELVTK